MEEATVFFTLDFNALGRIGPMDKIIENKHSYRYD